MTRNKSQLELTAQEVAALVQSREDFKAGRTLSLDEMRRYGRISERHACGACEQVCRQTR